MRSFRILMLLIAALCLVPKAAVSQQSQAWSNSQYSIEIPQSWESYYFHGSWCHSPKKPKTTRNSNYLTVYSKIKKSSLSQEINDRIEDTKKFYNTTILKKELSQNKARIALKLRSNGKSTISFEEFHIKNDSLYIIHYECPKRLYDKFYLEAENIAKSFYIKY